MEPSAVATRPVVIRPGETHELETFSDFWLAMFEEVGIIHERDMAPEWRVRLRRYMERRIREDDARFLVALDGDSIVGTAAAIVSDGYPFVVHEILRGYVFGVRVAPTHRRRGIARRLTEGSIAFLRARGCAKIRLHASPFGRRIYEGLGFRPTNEMELAPERR